MTSSVFERFLASAAITEVFADAALIQHMLDFEAGLARAQAACGLLPAAAAESIAACCRVERFDIAALAAASGTAGSLAIPLVQALRQQVALSSPEAARWVHFGSTSQDVLDTALVLATRQALGLIDIGLGALTDLLLKLAAAHADTPQLARTLMQPAQVSSFGLKCAQWAAPLLRARERLRQQGGRSLQLQLGGAVGTLSAMGAAGPAVVQRLAADLQLAAPVACWHTQRDEWVHLGLAGAVLVGSLGKIATDLALMSQSEVGELAEADAPGRGGSSAMPHKRNPVGAMVALAAARRVPQRAAALLACMDQSHERGLGSWQAELAEWPGLWLSAHGALAALLSAFDGLQVDTARMRANIERLQGLVFAEAAAALLAAPLGKAEAHALLEGLSRRAVAEGRQLAALIAEAVPSALDPEALRLAFDIALAVRPAAALARAQRITLLSGDRP